jgi:hypothetical protein
MGIPSVLGLKFPNVRRRPETTMLGFAAAMFFSRAP